MSKAFTKEDDAPALTTYRPLAPAVPPGVKNYLTEHGAQRLREELNDLVEQKRPTLLNDDRDQAKEELASVDQRIAYLGQSLASAEIVSAPSDAEPVVRFGAEVRVRNRAGEILEYRIVGVDEVDIDKGWVSWRSPIAKALLNSVVGQRVRFRFPAGEDQLEVLSVRYGTS